jgi:hypothetical protein
MSAMALLAALLSLASPTKAPSAEEQRLYADGTRALAAGDARGAEKAWRAGYALAHDPAFLVPIGEAQEKAGAPAEALETYRRYLREAPDASDRADIEQRVARLGPAAPPVAPLPSEATGEFGGTPPEAPATAAPRPRATPSVDTEKPSSPVQTPDSGWNRYNVTAFVAAGATVLLLGTAAFFAAEASGESDDVNRLVNFRERTGAPDRYSAVASQYEQAMADGPRHDRYAKTALIAAAGTAVVSVAFFVLDAKLTPESSAGATVALSPAPGLGLIGGWSLRF